jgi:GTPase SAR1 family protein
MDREGARAKLVVMGAEGVRKTAIIKRFLFNSFQREHIRTVEEQYSRNVPLDKYISLRVSILDTSGREQFPAI